MCVCVCVCVLVKERGGGRECVAERDRDRDRDRQTDRQTDRDGEREREREREERRNAGSDLLTGLRPASCYLQGSLPAGQLTCMQASYASFACDLLPTA